MMKRAHAEALPIFWAGVPSMGRPTKPPPGVQPTTVPTTPKRRERRSRRRLSYPMRKRAHAEALAIFFWGRRSIGGAANGGRAAAQAEDDTWPTKEAEAVANRRAITEAEVVANRRAIRGGTGGQPTGPHGKEEVVEAQGHRAPYGVEEATRARGGEESESKEDRGEEEEVSSDEETDSKANQPAVRTGASAKTATMYIAITVRTPAPRR